MAPTQMKKKPQIASSTKTAPRNASDASHKPYLNNKSLWTAVAFQQEFTEALNNGGLSLSSQKKKFEQDPTKRKPTLAQKMGLKEGPPRKLTDLEWDAVEQNLETKRESAIEDGCPICIESFGVREHICITNCGHIFHENCLKGFEKCNTWKKRSCPMCRLEDYQRKETKVHVKFVRKNSTIVIQSMYRGCQVRKKFQRALFEKYPDKHQEYCLSKLSSINSRLEIKQKQEEKEVDDFLSKIDEQVKKSLLILNMQDDEWLKVEQKVNKKEEKDEECPICLCTLEGRKCVVTSCGHIFHEKCLCSFEKFIEETTHKCPVCRQVYITKSLN